MSYGTGVGSRALERYAWVGGILYVVALLGEALISAGYKLSQDDSAATIAQSLADHRKSLIVVFSLPILYAVGFVIWLTRLDDLLRRSTTDRRFFASWVLIGGVLFVALVFMLAAGLQILTARPFPRRLGWLAIASSPFLFLQAFGLGGVVATFGLALDLIGFVLLLMFVAATSVVGLVRSPSTASATLPSA